MSIPWFVTASVLSPLLLLGPGLKSHRFSKLNYMTNARFSNSY
jgi:hypothetical protein